MDQNEMPCIVQALRAISNNEESPPKRIAPAASSAAASAGPRSTPKKPNESPAAACVSQPPPPSSISRCTRSQAAPDWTTRETLVLVGEVAAVGEGWSKSLSSFQKWKIASDGCAASGVFRSSNQCKRRWDQLLADYRMIRKWGSKHGLGSYWHLDEERRRGWGLPGSFDEEVYGSMDAVIAVEEARGGSRSSALDFGVGTDYQLGTAIVAVDAEVLHGDAAFGTTTVDEEALDADASLDCEEEPKSESQKNSDSASELASKLQKNAEHIHSILRGELQEDAGHSHVPVDLTLPNAMETALARRKADELIKSLGGLVSTLNQFTDLVKDGGVEGIISMN